MIRNINNPRHFLFCSDLNDENITITISGDVYLQDGNYDDYGVWFNHLGLFLHAIFYLCLAYIFLRFLRRK